MVKLPKTSQNNQNRGRVNRIDEKLSRNPLARGLKEIARPERRKESETEDDYKLVGQELGKAYREKFDGLSKSSKEYILRFLRSMPGRGKEAAEQIDELRNEEMDKKGRKIENLMDNYISKDGRRGKKDEPQKCKPGIKQIMEEIKQIEEENRQLM
jgi:hypothetical protein